MNRGVTTYEVWRNLLFSCLKFSDHKSSPRGKEVRELINGRYVLDTPAYLNVKARKLNLPFMFAEAWWILSGSNRLSDLTPYMKVYANFSDDGVFLRGAYGPKVVDQLPYVVDAIAKDNDTRQAVLTIWRERPGQSVDIPCTVAMQFLLRDGKLNTIVTMRSQDVVLGFTYDVFTFSMVAESVRLLLNERGLLVDSGKLYVNAGSLHLYKSFYNDVEKYLVSDEVDLSIDEAVSHLNDCQTFEGLRDKLKFMADELLIDKEIETSRRINGRT